MIYPSHPDDSKLKRHLAPAALSSGRPVGIPATMVNTCHRWTCPQRGQP